MISKMAWRNLWRNRRRTIITLVSIGFGLLLSNTFTSISAGTYGKLIDSAAESGSGHVTIEPEGYRDDPGNDRTIKNAAQMAETLRAKSGVTHTSVRIVGQLMAATADGSTGAGYMAIDPAREAGALFMLKHLKEGRALKNTTEKKALIGSGMAKELGLRLGKKIVVTTTNKSGEVISGLVRVAGIFETGVLEVDTYMMLVPLDYMRTLLGYAPDEATQVVVMIDERRKSTELAQKWNSLARPNGGVAQPWDVMMPDVAGFIAMDNSGNYVFQIFIFLLIGAGILNTVLMSVLERMKEFGVLIAIGMSPRRLWGMIMSETLFLAIIGIVFGTLISIPVYYYLHVYGLDMSAAWGENATIGGTILDPVMRAGFYWDYALTIVGGVFGLIMLSGIYPAFIASKADPVRTINTL